MPRRLVNFRVDTAILADFDRWCEEHKTTRTAALESYMLRQTSHDQVRQMLTPVKVQTPNPPTEKQEVKPRDCMHPTGMRIAGTCMVCGATLKAAK